VVYTVDGCLCPLMLFLIIAARQTVRRFIRQREVGKRRAFLVGGQHDGFVMHSGVKPHATFVDSVSIWSQMNAVYPQTSWGYDPLDRSLHDRRLYGAAAGAWILAASMDPTDVKFLHTAALSARAEGVSGWRPNCCARHTLSAPMIPGAERI
jgi:hypothetical protein